MFDDENRRVRTRLCVFVCDEPQPRHDSVKNFAIYCISVIF